MNWKVKDHRLSESVVGVMVECVRNELVGNNSNNLAIQIIMGLWEPNSTFKKR